LMHNALKSKHIHNKIQNRNVIMASAIRVNYKVTLGVKQFETQLHAHAYFAADFNKSTPSFSPERKNSSAPSGFCLFPVGVTFSIKFLPKSPSGRWFSNGSSDPARFQTYPLHVRTGNFNQSKLQVQWCVLFLHCIS